MAKRNRNPIAFTPLPVTFLTSIAYLALLVSLLVVHHSVPSAPTGDNAVPGVNISEAWLDLKVLTNGFHPYNSRRNDFVRNWLLQRLESILDDNNATSATVQALDDPSPSASSAPVVIFNDIASNLTFSSNPQGSYGVTTYFEGSNIMVYIRGKNDDEGEWWRSRTYKGPGGVLVNAHFDSVSTGYGATDDGVGVVSVMQLVKYFTTPGNQPHRGIIALMNNGEEDFLNGARAFSRHPVSRLPHCFLNLEGAGAGGRATLFRTTDTEVTQFYRGTRHPFGTVVSDDGFKRGVIRSQTDYVIFNDALGMRGLDVAFMEPRARYHTDEDDTRHTSIDSLWHMLSQSLHTAKALSSDTSSTFEGDSENKGKVSSGIGTGSVWFDLFGKAFVVFELHTLFALNVTLLVTAPIALIVVVIILSKQDKLYIFSTSTKLHPSVRDGSVDLHGLRGLFRFPIIFVISTGGVIGLAFLLAKLNPHIAYSSPYPVWSMMLGWWIFATWFMSRAMDFLRPTAFHRTFALLWMFLGGWVALVVATVYEERLGIASGYLIMFYFACISVATIIAFCEQFLLEEKSSFAESQETETDGGSRRPGSHSNSSRQNEASEDRAEDQDGVENDEGNDGDPTESTSLLQGGKRTTFANYSSSHDQHHEDENEQQSSGSPKLDRVYEFEQAWSWSLPSSTWLLQFLIVAPFNIILIGQVALLYVASSYQTSADGNPPLVLYLIIAILSVLIAAPLGPFLHRFTYHIPTFLFFVVVGTMIYNLIAFPFSGNNRLKLFFIQRVDLDAGINEVGLSGIGSPYMDEVLRSLPSAAGQKYKVEPSLRPDLVEFNWHGLAPRVVDDGRDPLLPPDYKSWLQSNASRVPGKKEATFFVQGRNTRSCRIYFNSPVTGIDVDGSDYDPHFPKMPDAGSRELRLWSREWENAWNVTVRWSETEGLDGIVSCLWNDENGTGTIPALDEIRRFAPDWVTITKLHDGLVEGFKPFMV